MVLGLDAEVPKGTALPLGPTGLGLRGIGGDFAYNFVARLEKNGNPIPQPSAKDYVAWARDSATALDRWKPGPIDKTAVGVGIRAVICTMADMGFVFELDPIGFSFLTPGGAIILGGKGKLLQREGLGVEGYFVIDIASASLALGAVINVDIKAPGEIIGPSTMVVTLLKGFGQLDMFFSFSDPTAWFIDIGTETKPCRLEVLTDVPIINIIFSEKAEAYFRINNHRIAFGAKLGIGGEFKIGKIITLIARLSAQFAGYVGWDPLLIKAMLNVIGELGIKVWKFSFLLTGEASPTVYLPSPTLFSFTLKIKLDLPWPIPDLKTDKTFGDTLATPPAIVSPLLAGHAVSDGANTIQAQKVTAIHALTETEWDLATEKPWPDVILVIPFKNRVTDDTGLINEPIISPTTQGGYTVTHELQKLELLDLVTNMVVPGINAVWADGPSETTMLHLLATDPMNWLTPHTDLSSWIVDRAARVLEVKFGIGAPQTFSDARRFDDLEIEPLSEPAELDIRYMPVMWSRVLRSRKFALRAIDGAAASIPIDQLVVFHIGPGEVTRTSEMPVCEPAATTSGTVKVQALSGGLNLYATAFSFNQAVPELVIRSQNDGELQIYALRYREARQWSEGASQKTLLVPGRYRLTVQGKSTAIHPEFSNHPDIYPSAPPIDWEVIQEFQVTYPETVRPFICSATFGDNKLFSKNQYPWTTWTRADWDPTQFGVGFPLYRKYHLSVRFLVPYISALFADQPVHIKLVFEADNAAVEADLVPVPASDGKSSKLPESQNWIVAHGGTVWPDAEVVLPQLLSQTGSANLQLSFNGNPGGQPQWVGVDQWTGYVSRFDDFRTHLKLAAHCVTVRYDAAGRHVEAACPPITGIWKQIHWADQFAVTEHLGTRSLRSQPLAVATSPAAVVGDLHFPDLLLPYPQEFSSPPGSWQLPPPLVSLLGMPSGTRFAQFAVATGVRFGNEADPIAGIGNTSEETTVEVITGAGGKIVALWLRTPEPVDWRRVTVTLTIAHATPASGCPTGHARRRTLKLDVGVLPSPDGSSAFLTGSLAQVPTCLPRGDYTLTLSFDPKRDGLPALRPSAAVGDGPEIARLKFLQPFGQNWPLPDSSGLHFPHIPELSLIDLGFDPTIWERAVRERWPFERLIETLETQRKENVLPASLGVMRNEPMMDVDAFDTPAGNVEFTAATTHPPAPTIDIKRPAISKVAKGEAS